MRIEALREHVQFDHEQDVECSGFEHRSSDWLNGYHAGLHGRLVDPFADHNEALLDAMFPVTPL